MTSQLQVPRRELQHKLWGVGASKPAEEAAQAAGKTAFDMASVAGKTLLQVATLANHVVADEHPVVGAKVAPPVQHQWLRLSVGGLCLGSVFGMMGGGGALITKPMLYYVFYIQPFKLTIFTTYVMLVPLSLLAVAIGQSKGCVVWQDVAMLFVLTSLLGTSLGAQLAVFIPDQGQLLMFALLIIFVAAHMWWKAIFKSHDTLRAASQESNHGVVDDRSEKDIHVDNKTLPMLRQIQNASMAVAVGILVGMLGVGGGFMLTPLLCHMGHTIDKAVPTSQAVILLNSTVGMLWYRYLFAMAIPASAALTVSSLVFIACCGIMASSYVASFITQSLRQVTYACLLLLLGFGTIFMEVSKSG